MMRHKKDKLFQVEEQKVMAPQIVNSKIGHSNKLITLQQKYEDG